MAWKPKLEISKTASKPKPEIAKISCSPVMKHYLRPTETNSRVNGVERIDNNNHHRICALQRKRRKNTSEMTFIEEAAIDGVG